MGDNLFNFLKSHPFWAVFIIIFAILPIIGLILPIFRRAFGSRGYEQTPSPFEFHADKNSNVPPDSGDKIKTDEDQEPSKEA